MIYYRATTSRMQMDIMAESEEERAFIEYLKLANTNTANRNRVFNGLCDYLVALGFIPIQHSKAIINILFDRENEDVITITCRFKDSILTDLEELVLLFPEAHEKVLNSKEFTEGAYEHIRKKKVGEIDYIFRIKS